ncbi:uncharacterized protein LOC122506052 [Leptopilina heterotoma]|uniref:uncharacterized protein LOC122506052 n=1 Tax=Leptopilina heterotoma TaxID=63436 RepID=UPI001CA9C9D8|nr:uncharacterized protein LOC122506052 [Leptopilina heterotoma]
MNRIISIIFSVCIFQTAVKSYNIDEMEYNLDDLKYDVITINQTVQDYKESIFLLLATNYELMEDTIKNEFKNITLSKLSQLQNEYGILDIENVKEPLKTCFANRSLAWAKKFKKCITKLRQCAVNIEIMNYMIPIQSYDLYFVDTVNNLELGINEEIFGNYEKKNYSKILTKEHYMELKSSELNILVDGLKGLSQNLIKLLTSARENVLSETKQCSFEANQDLNDKWRISERLLTNCFLQHNQTNSENNL